jgi:hypothetical protein
VSQATMETNAATFLGNPHTPSTTVTIGCFLPPNQLSPVQTTMVLTTSTSVNGLIPSMVTITAPFTQSETGPPFSYKIPGFDTNYVLSSSTLQTLSMEAGSSNAPLEGSMGSTLAPYNAFPYEGGHIPPSSPSFSSSHQHSVGSNVNYSSLGAGSQGLPSYRILVGSTLFSLFIPFSNNAFSLANISVGGNPGYGQQNPMQGIICAHGKTQEFIPRKDLGIHGNDHFPHQGCRPGATPSIANGTWVRLRTYVHWISRGKAFPKSLEYNASPTFYVLLHESFDNISTSAELVR